MSAKKHVDALLEATAAEIEEAIVRLESELERRRRAGAKREHITLQPE